MVTTLKLYDKIVILIDHIHIQCVFADATERNRDEENAIFAFIEFEFTDKDKDPWCVCVPMLVNCILFSFQL